MRECRRGRGLEVIHFKMIIPEHVFYNSVPRPEGRLAHRLEKHSRCERPAGGGPDSLPVGDGVWLPQQGAYAPTFGTRLRWPQVMIPSCLLRSSAGWPNEEKPLQPLWRAPESRILFGSYARGDFDDGSDLDVLIVLDGCHSCWEELVRSAELASDLSLDYGVTISRMIMTEEE